MKPASWVVALLAAGVALGCYNPNITDGGLACAPGRVCPDDFHCASDGRCYRAVDAGRDTGAVCTSPPPVPICSRGAAAGQACNPACQTGCSCGWCAIVNGTATCLTQASGTKKVGDVCDPSSNADCAVGLFCHPECGTGRCYKYCDPSSGQDDCASIGTTCSGPSVPGTSTYRLCGLPPVSCDAVSGGGCPPGLACYPFAKSTECDCVGTGKEGDPCDYLEDCAAGYSCIKMSGASGKCQKTCMTSADCSLALCQTPGMISYGYCGL